jgi:cytosine/adenosine deaminase-related metal-dependent hydrolase
MAVVVRPANDIRVRFIATEPRSVTEKRAGDQIRRIIGAAFAFGVTCGILIVLVSRPSPGSLLLLAAAVGLQAFVTLGTEDPGSP